MRLGPLSVAAWDVRENAWLLGDGGKTKVGCAVSDGRGIWTGVNIQHKYRSHDIHAEVNAISTMVATGHHDLTYVLVAAERAMFTPCGACLDWITEFGTEDTIVAWQSSREGEINSLTVAELMPHYPR